MKFLERAFEGLAPSPISTFPWREKVTYVLSIRRRVRREWQKAAAREVVISLPFFYDETRNFEALRKALAEDLHIPPECMEQDRVASSEVILDHNLVLLFDERFGL